MVRIEFPQGDSTCRQSRKESPVPHLIRFLMPSLVVFFTYSAIAREIPEGPVLSNWSAPLLWSPTNAARVPRETGIEKATTASVPLPFIAITPCRVADTRGNGFTGH